jgi:chromate transporter
LPLAGLAYEAAASGRRSTGLALMAFALVLAMLAAGGPDLGAGRSASGARHGTAWIPPMLLFLSGLKAGLLTFGGAYTAIPFVRDDAVGRGWVSDGQFLDSLALSGIIPAPLIIFATFVGYQAGGLPGALAITAGIFLPAFSFGLLFYDRLERLVEDRGLHRFLGGVAAGVVGLIAVTTFELGRNVANTVPSQPWAALILAGSLALLYLWKSKLNLLAVVIGSAALGALLFKGA